MCTCCSKLNNHFNLIVIFPHSFSLRHLGANNFYLLSRLTDGKNPQSQCIFYNYIIPNIL